MFEGHPVWVPSTINNFLYFDLPAFLAFTPGVPDLRIEYHAAGFRGLHTVFSSGRIQICIRTAKSEL